MRGNWQEAVYERFRLLGPGEWLEIGPLWEEIRPQMAATVYVAVRNAMAKRDKNNLVKDDKAQWLYYCSTLTHLGCEYEIKRHAHVYSDRARLKTIPDVQCEQCAGPLIKVRSKRYKGECQACRAITVTHEEKHVYPERRELKPKPAVEAPALEEPPTEEPAPLAEKPRMGWSSSAPSWAAAPEPLLPPEPPPPEPMPAPPPVAPAETRQRWDSRGSYAAPPPPLVAPADKPIDEPKPVVEIVPVLPAPQLLWPDQAAVYSHPPVVVYRGRRNAAKFIRRFLPLAKSVSINHIERQLEAAHDNVAEVMRKYGITQHQQLVYWINRCQVLHGNVYGARDLAGR